jgi:RNA polymerase sigma factor (sigma-70 family)
MNGSEAPFPSPEEGLRLHLLLCADDPLASAEVCRAYVVPLCAWLGRFFPATDPHLIQDAVHHAVVRYIQQPTAYDPARADLGAYLRMAARRDLFNLFRREKRHRHQRLPESDVELGEESGNILGRDEEPSFLLEREEETARQEALLKSVRESLTPAEGRVLDLLLAGERDTRVFAEALGVDGLPAEEQAREVKRAKDRLKKRLERGGRDHE